MSIAQTATIDILYQAGAWQWTRRTSNGCEWVSSETFDNEFAAAEAAQCLAKCGAARLGRFAASVLAERDEKFRFMAGAEFATAAAQSRDAADYPAACDGRW